MCGDLARFMEKKTSLSQTEINKIIVEQSC